MVELNMKDGKFAVCLSIALLTLGFIVGLMFKGHDVGRYDLIFRQSSVIIFDTKTAKIQSCISDGAKDTALVCVEQTKRMIEGM